MDWCSISKAILKLICVSGNTCFRLLKRRMDMRSWEACLSGNLLRERVISSVSQVPTLIQVFILYNIHYNQMIVTNAI